MAKARQISGWGRQFVPGAEVLADYLEAASADAVLFRGSGRSYGDASLPPSSHPFVVSTRCADLILEFDESSGRIRMEAGLQLAELNRIFLPRGWFTPVSPGTKFVTVGGMVAADVHGKNHHLDGSFGNHVVELKLRTGTGAVVTCSRTEEPELFRATIGGMGLTGHILEAVFQLRRVPSPWIWCESTRVPNIDAFIAGLNEARHTWPYTVGWIDCLSKGKRLGRGILMRGRWAKREEAPPEFPPPKREISFPFVAPRWLLNRLTVRALNWLYYHWHPTRLARRIVHPDSFFYPLDSILNWNRAYGPRGFTQHQCVLPDTGDHGVARRFLELAARLGASSFLCVIKDCGPEGIGMLSFPRPGISIAMDIPIRDNTQDVVDKLNQFVVTAGGRIYLAKDRFTRPEDFRAMEPRLDQWLKIRQSWDPDGRIRSAQSIRLFGDPP